MKVERFATPRRNLVFARVGKLSLHEHWLSEPSAERNWDLQLSTWLPEVADDAEGSDFPVSLDPGVKFSSIANFFRDKPQIVSRYDYVMFPDDDLLFEHGGIRRLFDLCSAWNLTLAQPALHPSSYFSYPIVLQSPQFRLRFSTYIEPMVPIIRTDYLTTLLPFFERWQTGWGHDDVWSFLMEEPVKAAAIIDQEPIFHLRPLYTGELYESFREKGMDPREDVQEIQESFTNASQGKLVYGGILANGSHVGRILTSIINGLHLIRAATATRVPSHAVRTGFNILLRIATAAAFKPRRSAFKGFAFDPEMKTASSMEREGERQCAS